MRLRHWHDSLVVRAPAKVNLFLEVLGKRPDGYHEIATLMLAVRLYDTLGFKEDSPGQLSLTTNRTDLSTGADNLILKAARKLQEKTGCSRGARIHLKKRIPMAAGLAGGSTDAAATFLALNRLWNLGCSLEDLASFSSEIGSDIPFFFHLPAGWCTGRGEKVRPVPVGQPLDLVLLCPTVGLSTPAVYKGVVVPDQPRTGAEILDALAKGDRRTLGEQLHNRLQPSAEALCPQVRQAYERLRALAPAGQLMSGSGSSLFALGQDRADAERISLQLRAAAGEASRIYLVRSCK